MYPLAFRGGSVLHLCRTCVGGCASRMHGVRRPQSPLMPDRKHMPRLRGVGHQRPAVGRVPLHRYNPRSTRHLELRNCRCIISLPNLTETCRRLRSEHIGLNPSPRSRFECEGSRARRPGPTGSGCRAGLQRFDVRGCCGLDESFVELRTPGSWGLTVADVLRAPGSRWVVVDFVDSSRKVLQVISASMNAQRASLPSVLHPGLHPPRGRVVCNRHRKAPHQRYKKEHGASTPPCW